MREVAAKFVAETERATMEAHIKVLRSLRTREELIAFHGLTRGTTNPNSSPVYDPYLRSNVKAAGKKIAVAATQSYLSPHTKLGRRRLMRNYNNTIEYTKRIKKG